MTVPQKRVAAGALAVALSTLALLAQEPTQGAASPQAQPCPITAGGTTSSPCPCEPHATKPGEGTATCEADRRPVSAKPNEATFETTFDVPPPPMDGPAVPEVPAAPTSAGTFSPPMPPPFAEPVPTPTPTPERPKAEVPPAVVSEPDFDILPTITAIQPEPLPEPAREPAPRPTEPVMPTVLEATTPIAEPARQRADPVAVEPTITPARAISPTRPGGDIYAVPLRMLMRMGDGKPRFEVKTGDELLLKVYGSRLEMAGKDPMPEEGLPQVSAVGQVRFYGPAISGTCDQLSVLSSTGEILLRGNVQMKCKKGNLYHELNADELVFQLGGTGLRVTQSGVVPATYSRDE